MRAEIVAAFKQAGIGLPDPDVRLLRPQRIEAWREALSPNPPPAG